MKRGRSQLLPVILIVIIVVVSVAAIVALARTMFSGGANKPATEQQQNSDQEALLSTSVERGVRMSVRGEITADEQFRSYQIVVKPSSRAMTTYSGYLDSVIETASYENNTKAYDEFVHALDLAGMINGKQLNEQQNDIRGVCYGGKVVTFETIQNDQTVKKLWTTTCSNAKGSLLGSQAQLSNLFLSQIPDSQKLLKNIRAKQ